MLKMCDANQNNFIRNVSVEIYDTQRSSWNLPVNSSSYNVAKYAISSFRPSSSEGQSERTCQISRFIKVIMKMLWNQLRDR